MWERFENTKVLITVMTYPHPSEGYKELVCVAGITEAGEWVRLYPIDYRYRPRSQKFKKYQWIKVELSPQGKGNDNRKESRKPKLENIEILGEPLSTKDHWNERRKFIDALPYYTVHELETLYNKDKTSLGIVRPKKVLDVKVSKVDPEWKGKWKDQFLQIPLFGEPQKPLRKIPYKFQYVFECDDRDTQYNAMIEDWELGVLFLKESDRLGSDEAAAESVRKQYLERMCGKDRDTCFYMGTTFPYNTWLVLGVFYPPKRNTIQQDLF